jgi:hypothetical protein
LEPQNSSNETQASMSEAATSQLPKWPTARLPAAGAVLRREPPATGKSPAAEWSVSKLISSNVGNSERQRDQSAPATRMPSNYPNVGNKENGGPFSGSGPGRYSDEDKDITIESNVGNKEIYEDIPQGLYVEKVAITRLKGPTAYRPQGRSGPDKEVARLLREARKQGVIDRARAKGRDPNESNREGANGLSRSEKTQQQYLDRGNQLLARYRRERGIIQGDLLSLDMVEFADWVLSLKPTLKPTTWRPYKQSAKAVLSTLPDSDQAIEIIDADTVESGSEPERKSGKSSIRKKGERELPRRTSSLKAKQIPKPDFDRIVNYLRYLSSSRYAPILVDMLIAGLATGLRPSEWMATSLEIVPDPNAPKGRYVWLYVLNAKQTNGRANGFVRTLDLASCRDETVDSIRRMVDRGREWLVKGVYKQMQGQCAQLMYNTSERLFPSRKLSYCLYTTRHQFMANAKSIHSPEAVSAMAGHGVTNTATENYGKKKSAWNLEDIQDVASPVADEVATVKRRHTFFEDRMKLREAAGLKPMRFPGED